MHFCLTLTLSFVLFPFANSYTLAFLLKPFSFLPSHSLHSFLLLRRFSLCCHNNRQQPGPGWALLPFSLKIQPHVKAFVSHSLWGILFPLALIGERLTLLCMWSLSSLSPSQTTVFTPQRNTDLMFNYPPLSFLYNVLRRACHFASFTVQVRLSLPSWCSCVQSLLCSCTTWSRCRLIEKNSPARTKG